MHRTWKIAIVTIVSAIAISLISYFIYPTIEEAGEPRPEVYLFLTEYDFTNLTHLESLENEIGLKITISPVEAPYTLENVWFLVHVPLQHADLTSYKNQTIFGFSAQNLGQGVSTELCAFIDFIPPNTILNPNSARFW